MEYEDMISIPIHSNPVKSILVRKYSDIVQRCENPKKRIFKWYGGKGVKRIISRHDLYRWCFQEFRKFYELHGNLERTCVGRIDHSLHYEIGNMEIITLRENLLEQTRRNPNPNPTSNKFDDCIVLMALTVKTPSVELAKTYGVSNTAFNRVRNGSNWNWIYKKVAL